MIGHNEILNCKKGVKNDYVKISHYLDQFSEQKKKKLLQKSKILYQGDYAVNLFPHLLEKNDYQLLRNGVEQRAETILKLLFDIYRGNRNWSKVIPESIINMVYNRNHKYDFRNELDPKTLSFPYGPDIIKDRKGNWRVLEDNIGNVGGIGDLFETQKVFYKLLPQLKSKMKGYDNSNSFYIRLSSYYKEKARKGKGIALLFLNSYKSESDNETRRLAKIFRANGIAVLCATENNRRILINDKGVFYKLKNNSIEKIGYLILKNGSECLDLKYYMSQLQFGIQLDEYKIKKNNIDNIWEYVSLKPQGYCIQYAILKGLVASNFSPGVNFAADKMLGVYLDQLINYYQKKSPIINGLTSRAFIYRSHNCKWTLNRRMLNYIFNHKDQYVIKKSIEEGGGAVWIGLKNTKREFNKIKKMVEESPEAFVYQKFEPISIIENNIVDLRIHCHVDQERIISSDIPWGRANNIDGNGKVNISTGGMASPVFVLQ